MASKVTAWMSNTQSMMRNCKERSAKKTKELFWARSHNLKDGFHLTKMLIPANLKTNKRSLKLFTIRSCKRPIKALLKEVTVVNNTVKAHSKALQDQVLIKSIEDLSDFFLLILINLFYFLVHKNIH